MQLGYRFYTRLFSTSTSTLRSSLIKTPNPSSTISPIERPFTNVPFTILDKMAIEAHQRKLHVLPCVLMRAGTSKGVFIHKRDLPSDQKDWGPRLISLLGSQGCDPRQIDGLGGGTSTTSKVAVISPSSRPGIDVDFTFVQVAVGKESVDFSGNCGNILSGVGPFAVQEGLVKPLKGETFLDVCVYNTNTGRTVVETVEIDDGGEYKEDGDFMIPGVGSSGSEVKVAFVKPAGSMTGKLFPSGLRQQGLTVKHGLSSFQVRVTLIDAANPFVHIDSTSISTLLQTHLAEEQDELVESIRTTAAVEMGLAPDVQTASETRGTPKAVLVYPPVFSQEGDSHEVRVLAYSMGKPHPTLPLTGAVAMAAALRLPGTIAAELSQTSVLGNQEASQGLRTPERTPSPSEDAKKGGLRTNAKRLDEARIAHGKGTIRVGIGMGVDEDGQETVDSCAVSRTARRLFEGRVRYYL